ncbi:MAG: type II toxin-antitoxin system RelE/ParE family toxin [Candidatus Binatia bacterium]
MSREVRGIRLPPEVQASIRVMHPDLKRRVRAAIDSIRAAPKSGKSLKRELRGWRSLAVGRVRIIYRETRAAIEIGAIGSRASIYLDAVHHLSKRH